MVERIFITYVNSFKGLRREVWWLALVTLINRAGTMVFPFLSLYLSADLGFSLKNVGWILSSFGLGSVIGAWIGGKLTDRWGFYPVIFWSLVISGIMFIGIQHVRTFEGLCIAIFILMVVADCFRPAVYVAINAYSKPKNRTRSVTLIRLAINLGFSVGPAAGGLIITLIGYKGLFWADGLTCILAGLFFIYLLDKKQVKTDTQNKINASNKSPYKDKPYLIFLTIVLLIGFAFLQFFSTIPLFYRDIHHLSEEYIGLIMAMNGLLIFILEMPLVKFVEHNNFSLYRVLFISTFLFAISFFILNLTAWTGILVIGMVGITVGEMLNFPFLNRFALDRAENGKTGDYMALFTMAFSLSHIFGHNTGMQLVEKFGFAITWYIMTGVLIIAALMITWLYKVINKESKNKQNEIKQNI